MRRLGFAILVSLAFTHGAFAQWVFEGRKSDFDSDGLNAVIAENADYALVFRCKGDEKELIYVIPEFVSDKNVLKLINSSKPKFLLKVDGGKSFEQLAVFEVEKLGSIDASRVYTRLDPLIVQEILKSKSRVSVALRLRGDVIHETSFSPKGAANAFGKFLKVCKLDEAS